MHSDDTYYIFFELDTGSIMRFVVKSSFYRNAYLHEWGKLTFQGTRLLSYESNNNSYHR